MRKMEMARWRLEYREKSVESLRQEIKRHQESLSDALKRGSYNEAAQYAEKIAAGSYSVDAIERELAEVNAILNDFEKEVE